MTEANQIKPEVTNTEAFQNTSAAVVVVGAFAPSMFHPLWFERYELLGKQEAEKAADPKALVVSTDVTLFKVAGFDFDIRPDRMQIGTTQENLFGPLRDLVVSSLDILDATPATAVGINWSFHFSRPSEDAWHAAGHKMIPYGFWSDVWAKHIGMKNVTVELTRDDEYKGYVHVSVQPSNVIKTGVFVSVNDHYDLSASGKSISKDASSLIEKQWEFSDRRSAYIAERVRKECSDA